MKKFLVLVCMVILSTFCLAGCGETENPYKPSSDKNYYEYNNAYRVMTLESATPTVESRMPIRSYFYPVGEGIELVKFTIEDSYEKYDMFFSYVKNMNSAGFAKLYTMLNLAPNSDFNNEIIDCMGTNLYTMCNPKKLSSKTTMDFKLDGKPFGSVFGEVGDANVYKINYEYISKSTGEVVERGSFSVFVIIQDTIATSFVAAG